MVWLRAAARAARTLRLSHVTRDNGAIEEARIIEVAETDPAGSSEHDNEGGPFDSTLRFRARVVSLCEFQSSRSGQVWNSGTSQTGPISSKTKSLADAIPPVFLVRLYRPFRPRYSNPLRISSQTSIRLCIALARYPPLAPPAELSFRVELPGPSGQL